MTGAITFSEFVAPEKENPYTETVAQHIAAAEKNPNAAVVLEADVNDIAKEQFKYQRAANAAGKTAKIRLTDKSGVKQGKPDADGNIPETGNVKVTLTITALHKARRRKKGDAAEVPAEDAAV